MSFWKKLFGGGAFNDVSVRDKILREESYKGFLIKAIEVKAGAELQLAGLIEKEVDGELKSYRFVRADRMTARDDLVTLALNKGRQIIDEQGEALFN